MAKRFVAALFRAADVPTDGNVGRAIDSALMVGVDKTEDGAMFKPVAFLRAAFGLRAIAMMSRMGEEGVSSNGDVTLILIRTGRANATAVVTGWALAQSKRKQACAQSGEEWIDPMELVDKGRELFAADSQLADNQ
jgi:hypothetical protein